MRSSWVISSGAMGREKRPLPPSAQTTREREKTGEGVSMIRFIYYLYKLFAIMILDSYYIRFFFMISVFIVVIFNGHHSCPAAQLTPISFSFSLTLSSPSASLSHCLSLFLFLFLFIALSVRSDRIEVTIDSGSLVLIDTIVTFYYLFQCLF